MTRGRRRRHGSPRGHAPRRPVSRVRAARAIASTSPALTGGRAITIYGQNEVVHDLIEARLETGRPLTLRRRGRRRRSDMPSTAPCIRFRRDGALARDDCDFIAGCDGFHGVCRPSIPAAGLRIYERVYPFGWLGILAEARPSPTSWSTAVHERGFALFSMRSPHGHAAVPSVRAGRGPGGVARRADLVRARNAARDERRVDAERGTDSSEGRDGDAQLRRRADATTGACSSPATRRTSCRRRAPRGSISRWPTSIACRGASAEFYRSGRETLLDALLGARAAADVARAALLVVDDVDAARRRQRRTRSTTGASSPNWSILSPPAPR